MGARQQGRVTTRATVSAIDNVTRSLGSIELQPLASRRSLQVDLEQLAVCMSLFELARGPEAAEAPPFHSIRRQLHPLIESNPQPTSVTPPFSPDTRQRISYATAQLVAMRLRLTAASARIPNKVVQREAATSYLSFRDSWGNFRADPSLENLAVLEGSICYLSQLYRAFGIRSGEPRAKGVRKLCELVQRANDRDGELDDVPGLMRQVTDRANELCRPTLAEHRAWLASVL